MDARFGDTSVQLHNAVAGWKQFSRFDFGIQWNPFLSPWPFLLLLAGGALARKLILVPRPRRDKGYGDENEWNPLKVAQSNFQHFPRRRF